MASCFHRRIPPGQVLLYHHRIMQDKAAIDKILYPRPKGISLQQHQ